MFGDTVPSELPDKWAMSIRQPIGDRRDHHALELPDGDPVLEDDARARRRQHRRVQAQRATRRSARRSSSSSWPRRASRPGVVNLVTGSGAEVGDAIVDSPTSSVISFTGQLLDRQGDRRARRPHASSASSLELGGKNAVVVLRDADLDLATDGILWSAFGTTGQRCTACSRVIVERGGRRRPLLERLESRARKLRLGSGLDETVDVGPLINAGRGREGRRYIDIGRREGELVIGGAAATRRRPRARQLLRADDLPRRHADGRDRAGGDLRAGAVGHPGRRLRRRR